MSAVLLTNVKIPAAKTSAPSSTGSLKEAIASTPLQRRTRSAESTTVLPRVSLLEHQLPHLPYPDKPMIIRSMMSKMRTQIPQKMRRWAPSLEGWWRVHW